MEQVTSTKAVQDGSKNAKNASIFTAVGVAVLPIPNVILEMTKRNVEIHNWLEMGKVQEGEDSCYKAHEQKIHGHVGHQVAKLVGEKLKETGFDIEFKSYVPENAKLSDEQLTQLEISNEGWASDQSKGDAYVITNILEHDSARNLSALEREKNVLVEIKMLDDKSTSKLSDTVEQPKSMDYAKIWPDTSDYTYHDIEYDD